MIERLHPVPLLTAGSMVCHRCENQIQLGQASQLHLARIDGTLCYLVWHANDTDCEVPA